MFQMLLGVILKRLTTSSYFLDLRQALTQSRTHQLVHLKEIRRVLSHDTGHSDRLRFHGVQIGMPSHEAAQPASADLLLSDML
jgi:hypothetical protein